MLLRTGIIINITNRLKYVEQRKQNKHGSFRTDDRVKINKTRTMVDVAVFN